MKTLFRLNTKKSVDRGIFIKSKVNLILTAVIFVTVVTIVAIIYFWWGGKINDENQDYKQVANACKKPKLKAISVATVKDEQPDYLKSDCHFSSYEPIVISGLDKTTCTRISKYFIIDKNQVYKQQYDPGSSDYSSYIILKEADSNSFRALKYGYYQDSRNLFYDTGENYKIVNGIDLKSIQILSTHFIKDKNNIFFSQLYRQSEIKPLQGFDVDSFSVVQNNTYHEQYFKDKNGVYFSERVGVFSPNSSKIHEANVGSIKVMQRSLLAKDNNFVYYNGKIVSHLDALTFEELDGGYYRDARSIYTRNFNVLPNSDSCTFELIGYKTQYEWSGYAKDKNQVYYHDSIVEGADPSTFQAKEPESGIYGGFDKNFQYEGRYRIQNK
ncbi:MAG: DKNYY domain-containing protein [Patescibacteria group bacterium]